MFLDDEHNLCKISNETEIHFYKENCPEGLREFVPKFYSDFRLSQGKDVLNLDQIIDFTRTDGAAEKDK